MANSDAIVLKTVSLVMLFVATVVGCHAHFKSTWKDLWDKPGFVDVCKSTGTEIGVECPTGAIPMERTFVVLTILCLILSTLNLVAGFVMDISKIKVSDAGYHVLAGILVLISGVLLIVAALQIDNYTIKLVEFVNRRGGDGAGVLSNDSPFIKSLMPKTGFLEDLKQELRKELKYMNKWAAGSLAIINGALYFVTSVVILKS